MQLRLPEAGLRLSGQGRQTGREVARPVGVAARRRRTSSFRDGARAPGPESSAARVWLLDSGFAPVGAPRNDSSHRALNASISRCNAPAQDEALAATVPLIADRRQRVAGAEAAVVVAAAIEAGHSRAVPVRAARVVAPRALALDLLRCAHAGQKAVAGDRAVVGEAVLVMHRVFSHRRGEGWGDK